MIEYLCSFFNFADKKCHKMYTFDNKCCNGLDFKCKYLDRDFKFARGARVQSLSGKIAGVIIEKTYGWPDRAKEYKIYSAKESKCFTLPERELKYPDNRNGANSS